MPTNSQIWSELLQDNRWQLKRLEILQRDKSTCVKCGKSDGYKDVHHTPPYDGRLPWEYLNLRLETLCRDCHTAEHHPERFVVRLECLQCGSPVSVDEFAGWDDAGTVWCEPCALQNEELRNLHETFYL
jgi:hypothetical protein